MSKAKDLGLKRRLRGASKEERATILDGTPYEVGFGKPPRQTRFEIGNQAGRRGRPRGSENLATIVEEEFDATIEVTEAGKRRRLSKRRVGIRQLANKIATGDIKATALYIELLSKLGHLVRPQTGETLQLDERDMETITRIAAFLDGSQSSGDGGE
jgi:Family of unknown function (DUF5681)